jgi:hypothetical protein
MAAGLGVSAASVSRHALVLCCDEKSQVQALDRTQPGLPLKNGRAATMTYDYKGNGTTTLFAALTCSMARSSANAGSATLDARPRPRSATDSRPRKRGGGLSEGAAAGLSALRGSPSPRRSSPRALPPSASDQR